MRLQKFYFAIILIVFSIGCKKSDNGSSSDDTKPNIKAFYSLQNRIAAEFHATLSDTITDEFAHSKRLLAWIQQQAEVAEAEMYAPYVFDVKHKNGFSGNIIFTPKQTDPMLFTRGGGAGSTDGKLKDFKKSDDEKIITNKNVLVIVQYASDFYAPYCPFPECKHIQTVLDQFEYCDIDFNVTLKVNEGIPAFTDLSDYGIIIFNTHGTPTGLLSGKEIFDGNKLIAFSDDVEVADLPANAEMKLRNEELKLTSFWEYEKSTKEMTIKTASYELTFSFFQALPVQFDNSVLIGNYCYSGIQNGIMGDILEPKGLKSFYGYGYANGMSMKVTNELCYRAEETIITNLIDRDSTGIAHLKDNTTQLDDTLYWRVMMFGQRFRAHFAEDYFIFGPQTLNHYLDPGYHFADCGDTITDGRDGQQYPTVCIGEQVWMAENLNWAGAGACYDDNEANCDTYGRLYSIKELTDLQISTPAAPVKGICPDGWHVPSRFEYQELIDFCGGSDAAGLKLRSATGWPEPYNDVFGFNLKPAGYYVDEINTAVFGGLGDNAKLWTSSDAGTNYYAINAYNPMFDFGNYSYPDPIWKFSCRCIKD